MTVQIPADCIAAAQADRGGWHIPACADIAQYGVESAFGRFEPVGSFNGFGIQRLAGLPFVSAASHEFRGGKLVPVVEEFAKFNSLADAFYEHDKLIATNPVYAPAMAFVGNYVKYIELMGPDYATAPNYVKSLLALIEEDDLTKYNVAQGIAPPAQAIVAPSRTVAHLTPLSSIKSVQDALNRLGASPQLDLDGKYGVQTRAAVRWFQAHSGLAVDGDVGPLTIAALAKAAPPSAVSPAKSVPVAAVGEVTSLAAQGKLPVAPEPPGPGPTPAAIAAAQAKIGAITTSPAHVSIWARIVAALEEI
jgi:hypothetical protein